MAHFFKKNIRYLHTYPEHVSSDDLVDDVEDDFDEGHDDQLKRGRLADDDAEGDEDRSSSKVTHQHPVKIIEIVVYT